MFTQIYLEVLISYLLTDHQISREGNNKRLQNNEFNAKLKYMARIEINI